MKELDKRTRRRIVRDTRLLLACAVLAAGIYIWGAAQKDERTSSDSVQEEEITEEEQSAGEIPIRKKLPWKN